MGNISFHPNTDSACTRGPPNAVCSPQSASTRCQRGLPADAAVFPPSSTQLRAFAVLCFGGVPRKERSCFLPGVGGGGQGPTHWKSQGTGPPQAAAGNRGLWPCGHASSFLRTGKQVRTVGLRNLGAAGEVQAGVGGPGQGFGSGAQTSHAYPLTGREL